MQCPKCESTRIRKNGRPRGNQRYRCRDCGRQFIQPASAASDLVPISSNGHKTSAVADAVNLPPVEQLTLPWVDTQHQDGVAIAASELLHTLILPEFIQSEAFQNIISKIQQAVQPQALPDLGIAILLLDAENLNKFDADIENFLSNLCAYPLQVKIAFANWKNTYGDTELYERGYQLIHVPTGKNSADAQMISVGAAICRHYPDAKEVFVCSSDWLLTHLCNELHSQGLTVYRVRKQDNNLTVENRRTGEVQHYSLSLKSEIPSFEGLVKQIEDLIKEECDTISDRMSKLSAVANLFHERGNIARNAKSPSSVAAEKKPHSILPIEESPVKLNAEAASIPVSSATSINSLEELEHLLIDLIEKMTVELKRDYVGAIELKARFLDHYKEHLDLVVKKFQANFTLLKFLKSRGTSFKVTFIGKDHQVTLAGNESVPIKSPEALEQVLKNIVNNLTKSSPGKQIPIETLGGEFHKQYGVTITAILKHLKLDDSFNEFVQSCSAFKLQKSGKTFQVALASP